MSSEKVETGEVFYARNRYMNPPKLKYHLCIKEDMYFLINTKPHTFNCVITPDDCSLLSYSSYIDCTNIRIEPMREFVIIKKEQLSSNAIKKLIEKVKCVPTITQYQKREILAELNYCLEKRNS